MAKIWSPVKAYILEGKWVSYLASLLFLTLYFVTFSRFLPRLLSQYSTNVNTGFVGSAWQYLLPVVFGLYLIHAALFRAAGGKLIGTGGRAPRPALGDWFLILVPLTPVVQYVINNQDILSLFGSCYVLAVFAGFALLFIVVLPALLGLVCSARFLMILGVAFTYSITGMADLSARFNWLERGDLVIQAGVFLAVFLAGWILYNLAGRKFTYLAVFLFFAANTAAQLTSVEPEPVEAEVPAPDNHLARLVGTRQPLATPNIYLLVYDAYVPNETMLGYGIDNRDLERYLENLDFELYPGTYSLASYTIGTMGRTLDAAAVIYDKYRKSVSGDGIVQNLLKEFGYSTSGVFYGDFFFQGIGSSYDSSFPDLKATHKLLMKAVFMGEFRFDVEFDKPTREQFEKKKSTELGRIPDTPRFLYMHDYYPGHSQNSGACGPEEIDLFAERLAKGNAEMKKDLDSIIGVDPGAIIVVAGDHGPYLTKNCVGTGKDFDISEISRQDVQDRFGTFLAIRWPGGDPSGYDDISVMQDLFPAIFAYLFRDGGILEAKVESRTTGVDATSGVMVDQGIIHGGINDGEPLFLMAN